MFINLLTNVILWVHVTLKTLFSKPDYKVIDQSMEYTIDNKTTPDELDEFWEEEYEEWDGITESFYKNLNDVDYKNTCIPNNVDKTIVRIKYWYNDKMYKYLTYNMNHEWPPHTQKGISFNIPIVSAHLLDSYEKPVKDLLNKIKRYAGPRYDFYGEKIKISDMLYYDDETLEQEYPTIRLKNALGMVKNIDTVTGYITDLRIP
jgi:hypothetical protein|tara:strand:+ start:1351 stop:1962 length:612 start_codon:yes stop_codon:yes gene_type:complete